MSDDRVGAGELLQFQLGQLLAEEKITLRKKNTQIQSAS